MLRYKLHVSKKSFAVGRKSFYKVGFNVNLLSKTLEANLVQPRVDPAHGRLVGSEPGVVQQSEDGCDTRARGASTGDQDVLAGVENVVRVRLSGDVGVGPSGGVVQALPLVAQDAEVLLDGGLLPFGLGPDVGEATTGESSAGLGGDVPSAADSSDVWASGRESRVEAGSVLSIVGLAGGSRALVSGREEDGNTAGTKLAKHVANLDGKLARNGLLVLAVRCGQSLRELIIRKVLHVLEEVQVRLVRAVIAVRLVQIGDQRSATTGGVVHNVGVVPKCNTVLHVQVCLYGIRGRALVVKTAVNGHNGEVGAQGVRGIDLLELLKLGVASIFLYDLGLINSFAVIRLYRACLTSR